MIRKLDSPIQAVLNTSISIPGTEIGSKNSFILLLIFTLTKPVYLF